MPPSSVPPSSVPPSSIPPASIPPGGISGHGDPLLGTVLADRYRILRKLGEGGMGSVYLAEHTTINKRLAIKVLSPEYSHKQDLVERFLQEARAASMIEQENVVEITDFGSTPGGSVFFVMEYLHGEDLADTIEKTGPLPWSRVKPIIIQICDALAAAHEAGIIHRDMKPENCYRIRRRQNDDFIKVLDFGIAKVTSEEGEGGRGLTRTGMIFGTPEYMSPEQAKGERVDVRVDVYAVGVIMFELLTGRVPFTADTFMGILTKHMFEAPPAPSTVAPDADIPPEVEAIILKALQKDREYRFQSMREMAAAVRVVGSGGAAVSVVAEQVTRPTTGQIRYSTEPPMGSSIDDELVVQKSKLPLVLGGSVLGLSVVALVLWLMPGDEPTPPLEPVASAAVPVESEPEPQAAVTPEPEATKPAFQTVMITVKTPGVDGRVIDDRDQGELGMTNKPLEVAQGKDVLNLVIRAEGHDETLIPVIPDQNKTIPVTLKKIEAPQRDAKRTARRRGHRRSNTRGSSSKPPVKEDPKNATAKEHDNPPKRTSSPDLKDPFAFD
jgi:serine/threonine-protein kinase